MTVLIKSEIRTVQTKLTVLQEKYESIEKEINKITQQLKYASHGLKERIEGNIVWKLGRCNKTECYPCRELKKNTHGPYPNLVMTDKNGKVRTRYISLENYHEIDRQFELTRRVKNLEESLIRKEQEKQKIEQTINDLLYRLDVI